MRTETKEVTVTVYVARDGREFDSEDKCREHESFLHREEQYDQAKAHIKKLRVPCKGDSFPFIPVKVFMENRGNMVQAKTDMRKRYVSDSANMYDASFYELNSKEDAQALAEVMAHDSPADVTAEKILKRAGKLSFPCTVLYSSSYGWGREMGTINKELELIRKYCKLHGYDISLKEIDK